MRQLASLMLLLVAFVHLMPLVGVLGPARLQALYGLPIEGPDLAILMRHRAVLFGLLGLYQAWAVFHPEHRSAAFIAGIASLGAFLALVVSTPGHNAHLAKVATIDVVALVLAIVLPDRRAVRDAAHRVTSARRKVTRRGSPRRSQYERKSLVKTETYVRAGQCLDLWGGSHFHGQKVATSIRNST